MQRRDFIQYSVGATGLALSVQNTGGQQDRQANRTRKERTMSTGALSKARLGRMHDIMAAYVERGDVPGLVTLVSRRGEVHVDAIGMKAVGGSDPIGRDTIFRIASMTKPITAA